MLFVCTGNICRSPMAEFLAAKLAREAGLPWTTSSAGVAAEIGEDMTLEARRALEARGIKGVRHVARQLDGRMMEKADQVYALTNNHRRTIIETFPFMKDKVLVLRTAAGLPDGDIADPYAMSQDVYENCATRIQEALTILIRRNSHAENYR